MSPIQMVCQSRLGIKRIKVHESRAHHVEVALLGVELDRKAAHVTQALR